MYIDDYGKLKTYYPSDRKLWLMISIDKISHNSRSPQKNTIFLYKNNSINVY